MKVAVPVVVAAAMAFVWDSAWAGGIAVLGALAGVVAHASAAERQAFGASVGRAALVAIPFALAATLLGLLIVLSAEAPASALFAHVPAMMLDPGALLMTAIGAVAGTMGFRRPTPHGIGDWLHRHQVPAVMAATASVQLQRIRALRTAPAVLGYAIGTVSGSAYNVALDVLGPHHPASRAILAAASDVSPALLALVGYMAGVVLAEVTRRPPVDTSASARLETRRPRQYLTPTARRLPALLSVWVVTATLTGMLAGRSLDWRLPLIAAVLPGAIALIQHHIVRRPQRVITADALALDDTLRSSAAHALSGSASALLLVWAMEVTRRALIGDAGVPGTGWLLAATVATIGAYGLWSHYGSAHRGRRPERPDMAGTAEALGS